jgi:hypothetical protein
MTRWRRLFGIVALLAIALFPLHAQEAPPLKPLARARLEPDRVVTVGQPVTVVVEVLVPTWFTGAPRFPDLDVKDAITIFEDRGMNFTERIDNQTWAGQSRSYFVYPQRSGTFEIATLPVRLRYFSDSGGSKTEATVSPDPIRIEAVIPPEARDLDYFISTTGLRIEHAFDHEPGIMKVGEAFTRTVTVTVNDALSMVIPPFPSDPVPGLAVYPDPAAVKDDGGDRGEGIIGTRVERATFVAEQEGDYLLPAIEFIWWDVKTQRLRTATIPEMEFHVEPNPDLVVDLPLPPEDLLEGEAGAAARSSRSLADLLRRWALPLAGLTLALLLLSRLWRRYGAVARQRWVEFRRRRSESEAEYYAAFRKAARQGDPVATWNSWAAWLDRIHTGTGAATIRAFVQEAGDPDLKAEADTLDAALFVESRVDGGTWSGRNLARRVARVRRKGQARVSGARKVFGPLNPGRD